MGGLASGRHKIRRTELSAPRKVAAIPCTGWEHFLTTFAPINSHYWNHRDRLQLFPIDLIAQSFRETFAAMGLEVTAVSRLASLYWEVFSRSAVCDPHAHPLLQALEGHALLGLVTNGYLETQRPRIAAAGLTDYFQAIVVSEEVGYRKPAPEIFHIALQQLGVTASETLCIGDSLEHDLQGAVNAQMDFCWYDRQRRANPYPVLPRFTIGALMELLGCLDSSFDGARGT